MTPNTIAAVVLCFALAYWILGAIASALGVPALVVWVTYYAASHALESRRLTHRPAWRASRFAAWVSRRLMRTRFSDEALAILADLDPKRARVFVCEPHGPAALYLAFGFAAHGGALPAALAERTLVVAHWCFLAIPILRNLYAAFGVVDNRPATIKAALADGLSVALTPSGIVGKYFSLIRATDEPRLDTDDDDDRTPTVTVYRSRTNLGPFEYAARYRAEVVVLVSPDEDATYRRVGSRPPWIATLGPLIYLSRLPLLEWRLGRPIDTRELTLVGGRSYPTAETVAAAVYAEMSRVAAASHRLRFSYAQIPDRWWWRSE